MSYIGNTNTQQAFTPAVDFFNGNGSTTAFTLSKPVASVEQVQAVISNVPQAPGTAYTVSGNTITFTSAPPSGTNNIYVYYTSPITQVIAPGQGTVITTSLVDGSVTPAKMSTGGPSWDTSGNVTLTGNITLNNGAADGAQLTLASSGYSNWNIDNYSGNFRWYYNATEYLRMDTNGNLGIGTTSPGSLLHLSKTLSGSLTSAIQIQNYGTFTWGIGIDNAVSNSSLVFQSGGAGGTTRMTLDSSGNLLVGTTTTSAGFVVLKEAVYGGWYTRTNHPTGVPGGYGYADFLYNGSNIGSITQNGSTAVAYNTTSDYRLKENVQPLSGALARVAALKPCTYTWKSAPDEIGEGFIAHELAEICPQAVTGEKDAVNEDGSIKPQSIDTSFLVATLTAAIQEQQAIIETLTNRITALESK